MKIVLVETGAGLSVETIQNYSQNRVENLMMLKYVGHIAKSYEEGNRLSEGAGA